MIIIARVGSTAKLIRDWTPMLLIFCQDRQQLEIELNFILKNSPVLSRVFGGIIINYQECSCKWNEHDDDCVVPIKTPLAAISDIKRWIIPSQPHPWKIFFRRQHQYPWESNLLLFEKGNFWKPSELTLWDVHPFLHPYPFPSNERRWFSHNSMIRPLLKICKDLYLLNAPSLRELLDQLGNDGYRLFQITRKAVERHIRNQLPFQDTPSFLPKKHCPIEPSIVDRLQDKKGRHLVFINTSVPNDFLEDSVGYNRARHVV